MLLNENVNICEGMGRNISTLYPKEGEFEGRVSPFKENWRTSGKIDIGKVLMRRLLKSAATFLNAVSSSVEFDPGDRINYQ